MYPACTLPRKGAHKAVLDEESPSFLPNRRDALTGAMLAAALSAAGAAPDALLDDDEAFVMIDGWVFRREDLVR